MKVDSEVDLILKHEEPLDMVTKLLHRLLSIHFKCSKEAVVDLFKAENSLSQVIQNLGDNRPHKLMKLETGTESPLLRKLAGTQFLDPGEPISPAHWMREAIEESETESGDKPSGKKSKGRSYIKLAVLLLAGLLMAWGLNTLWNGVLDKEAVMTFLEDFRTSAFVIPVIFSLFLVAGLVAAPINLLLVASTVTIGPWMTLGCGLTGALLSAAAAFYAGKRFGKPLIKKVAKKQLEKLSRQVANRGILSVAMIRLVPIAPFVVVNLVAGFSSISFSTFLFGSILGMVPGMFGVVWVTHTAQAAFTDPQWQTWLMLGCGVAVIGVAFYLLRKKFK